jgi:ATP-dependent DNA helicase RecQ
MSAIYRSGQRFGAQHVIAILRGEANERVIQFGHEQLSTFGIGAELNAKQWSAVIRQLLAGGLIDIDASAFGSLKLNEASRRVLRGDEAVWLRKPEEQRRERKRRDRVSADKTSGGAVDNALFERLRSWRASTAKTAGVPPYVIFHDATLSAIAAAQPTSHAELGGISGIGVKKLERYGDEILGVLRSI